jgi:Ion channel
MTQIELEWERSQHETHAAKKRKRDVRRKMTAPDSDSRPPFMWHMLARFYSDPPGQGDGHVATNGSADCATTDDETDRAVNAAHTGEHSHSAAIKGPSRNDRAKAKVEQCLLGLAWVTPALGVGLFVVDTALASSHPHGAAHGLAWLGVVILAVGLLSVAALLIDVASYRPRLFARCAESAEGFFHELAELEPQLTDSIGSIRARPPSITSLKEHREKTEQLVTRSQRYLVLDGIRFRITRRMMGRLAGIIVGLAMVSYGLDVLFPGQVLHTTTEPVTVGFQDHIYFALTTFFTIGFGDLRPAHTLVGHLMLILIIVCFAAVVYFVLTDIVASHGEFRTNVRTAAATFVFENSTL